MEEQYPVALLEKTPNLDKVLGEVIATEIRINDEAIHHASNSEYKRLRENLMMLQELAYRKGLTISWYDDPVVCQRVITITRGDPDERKAPMRIEK
jgi:hypothetical protein